MNIYVIYLLVVMGIAIFGGSFVKYSVGGINVTYLIMGLTVLYYIKYFCFDMRNIKNESIVNNKERILDKTRFAILIFSLYGLMRLALSYFNITDVLISDRLLIDNGYVFRQGYYLLIFPLLFVISDYEMSKKVTESLAKYRYIIFIIIYLLSIIFLKKFALSISTTFTLAYISLVRSERNPFEFLMFLLILLTPIAIGGEITNVLIRIIYVAFYFINKENVSLLFKILRNGSLVCVALCFILPYFWTSFKGIFDANSFWRLNYWYDELNELKHSCFLGVGFGTSYASNDFVAGNIFSGPFAADAQYSVNDKMFVVGSHNSIISTTFRLGLIGGGVLLYYLFSLAKKLENISDNNMATKVYGFLFFSSLVIVSSNVGFESPYYFFIFIFSNMMCLEFVDHCESNYE